MDYKMPEIREPLDASALAHKMLKWEQLRRELDELEDEIKYTVERMGKTQTVGNVRASYSAGRKKYDYQAAGEMAYADGKIGEATIATFTVTSINWKMLCERAGIVAPFTQSPPSVSIKLL